MPDPIDAPVPPQRFVAVATEYNVLNLVAIRALAQPGDEVLVLADPQAQERAWGQRLAEVLEDAGMALNVQLWAQDRASAQSLKAACAQATVPWAHKQPPGSVMLLAIGGRKHDMLVMQEVLRRRCQAARASLQTVSVDRRPFRLRMSRLDAGDVEWQTRLLGDLPPKCRVNLDAVLAVHGYQRNRAKGFKLAQDTEIDRCDTAYESTGEPFEMAVLQFVRDHLPADLAPWVNEVWWNTEISQVGASAASTEFDVLLLACDGSVVHVECKGGAVQGLQRKVFQMRRAFTPESSIVLCRAVRHDAHPSSFADRRRSTLEAYANLGAFGLLQLDPGVDAAKALPGGVPGPAHEFANILRSTWL